MAILTGEPFYRYENGFWDKQVSIFRKGDIEGDIFNRIGNISIHPILDPFFSALCKP